MSSTQPMEKTGFVWPGLNSNQLKLIAIITMAMDHFGLALVDSPDFYFALRAVGRIAFPIFCFLLVEGLTHTSNLRRYILRMALFALISEVPFDLVIDRRWYSWQHQNVFVTLTLGLLLMALLTKVDQKFYDKWKQKKSAVWYAADYTLGAMLTAIFSLFAELAHCDYGALGIFAIYLFYMFRLQPQSMRALSCSVYFAMLGSGLEVWACLAGIPLIVYNGKRGKRSKVLQYGCYIFYPAHLLLLAGIRYLMTHTI